MIVPMVKVEVVGPRKRIAEAILALQDASVLHLAPVSPSGLAAHVAEPSRRECRRRERVARALADVEAVLCAPTRSPGAPDTADAIVLDADDSIFAAVRRARRLRRGLAALDAEAAALREEQALLEKFRPFLRAFGSWLRAPRPLAHVSAYHVVLRPEQAAAATQLRTGLDEALGGAYELLVEPLGAGELALLLIVPQSVATRVDAILAASRVHEVALPRSYGASLLDAAPRMVARFSEIPRELDRLAAWRAECLALATPSLVRAWMALADESERLGARHAVALDGHVFVIAGWVPEAKLAGLVQALARACDGELVVETVGHEQWSTDEPPVVLANPRLFRPFEVITRLVPLPRYGSIDPTPFVAVFFPMFFGLMLGDVGYGLMLMVLALVLGRRTQVATVLRAIAEMAFVCGGFGTLFGLGFGELFGDAGLRWFGLHPLLFDRGERVVSFLGLALALGAVHVLLGLVLAVLTNLGVHRRTAAARAVQGVMLVLIGVAVLAVLQVLPAGLSGPLLAAALLGFPVLVMVEGIVAPIELLMSLAHVLSYARIMALGTASVMFAVVANHMAGAFGSVVIGALFALVFHAVNFALGLFGPVVHALRLHFVEFFGTFVSAGGHSYRPLAHPRPALIAPR